MVKFSALINTLFLKARSLIRRSKKRPDKDPGKDFLSQFSHIEQVLEAKLAEPLNQKLLRQHFFRKFLRLIRKILKLIAHFFLHFPILSRPLKKAAGFIARKKIFKRKLTYVVILVLIIVIIKLPWPMIFDRTMGFISYLITLGNPVKIEEPVTIFKTTDDPKFSLSIPQKSDKGIGKTAENKWVEGDETVSAEAIHKGTNRKQPVQIKKNKEGKFEITLSKKNNHFLPGEYTLKVSSKESFIYIRNLEQIFSWGVLAINTNKSIFTPGEEAKLSMGVIDDTGHTICDAKLNLKITGPTGNQSILTSRNGLIRQSGQCHGDSFVLVSDYQALFRTSDPGTYQMELEAVTKNGSHNIKDTFEVRSAVPFEIERVQFPSRIYPPEVYPVILTVKANQDFKGKIVDTVPSAFETKCRKGIFGQKGLEFDEGKNIPKCELNYAEGVKSLVWDADLKKGQSLILYYTIKFPPVSPEYYLLGPLRIIDEQAAKETLDSFGTLAINPNLRKDEPRSDLASFAEVRQWQIASDATTAIEQQINILNQTYSTTSTATTGMPSDNSLGLICYRNNTTANTECQNGSADSTIPGAYTGATVYFEADIKNSTGATTYAALYDSNGTLVTNSIVSTDSLTYTRVRSEAITSNLTSGTNYTARVYTSDATSTGSIIAARLIILQSTTGTFADTQTIAEIGANGTTTSTSMASLTNPKYFQYDDSKYDGTKTAYFETTIKAQTASVQVTNTAGSPTCAHILGTGADWSNPTNAQSNADSDAYATATLDGTTTDYMKCTSYDFSIPTDATIVGIVVDIERKTASGGVNEHHDSEVKLIDEVATVGTTNKATATFYTTSDVIEAHGSSSDLWNGSSSGAWTPAKINDADFGVAFKATDDSSAGAGEVVSVDAITVTIYYTQPASAYAQLYNRTNGVVVTGSSISTSNTTWTLIRSDVLTTNWDTTNADEYEMQFKTDNSGGAAGVANAKIVLAQNNGSGITRLETYHNYINNVQTQNAASIGTFATTSQAQLLAINSQNTSLTYNIGPSTYLYVLGGVSGSTISTVYKSTINYNTRDAGTFATTSQAQLLTLLRDSSGFISTVGSSSYLYLVGGFAAASRSTVYIATINSNTGNLDQVFATTSQRQLPATVDRLQSVNTTISGTTYVYVLGGTSGTTARSTIYKSTLNSTTGNIDQPFLTTSQKQLLLTTLRHTATLATIGSSTYIYVIGGEDNATTSYSTVYKSLLNAGSGDIDAAFTTTSQAQFPFQQEMHSTIAATVGPSTYLYVLGGSSPVETLTSIYKATLDTATGNVGSFNTTGQGSLGKINRLFSTATSSFGGSNYVYVIGGFDGSSLTYSTVYKSAISNNFDSFGFFNLFDPNNWQGGTFAYRQEGTMQPTTYGTTGTARLTPGGEGKISKSGTLTFTGSGDAGTFATTSQVQLLQSIYGPNTITSTVGSSTYVYILGGNTTSSISTNYKSTLNSTSGDLGAFATTSQAQLPQVIDSQNTITLTIGSSTYAYVLGGSNAGAASISTVYKSTLNSTSGDLGSFATTSQGQLLQGIRTQNTITSTIGSSTYVYALGGYDTGVSSQVSTVYKSTINSTSGDLGAFATTSQAQLLQKLYFQNTITLTIGSSTYAYVLGGSTATNMSTNYKSTLNSTSGDLGAFATTSQAQLPQGIGYQNTITSTVGSSTYVYILGGNAGFLSTVYKSTINSTSGDLGAFATTSQGQLLQGIFGQNTITSTVGSSTYVYALGGADSISARKSTVYKSTLSTSASLAFERKRSQAENLETLQGANQPFYTTSQSQLPKLISGHSTVLGRTGGVNYLYVLGGNNGSVLSTQYRSLIDANANAGTFDTTSQAQIPQVSQNQDAFVFRNPLNANFLFILGGSNSSVYSTVYRSSLNSSDGTAGSFATTNQGQLLQSLRSLSLATVAKPANYLYVLGGCNTAACGSGSSVSTVYKATISIPADLGAFATTSQGQLFNGQRWVHTSHALTLESSTYLYVIAGCIESGGACLPVGQNLQYTLNSNNGNVGNPAVPGDLPINVTEHSSSIAQVGSSSYLYVLGGDTGGSSFVSSVYKSTINSTNGTFSTFATTNQAQVPILIHNQTSNTLSIGPSTYMYTIGGHNPSSGVNISTIYKSTIDSNGEIVTFATTSQAQLPSAFDNHTTVSLTIGSSTYIYILGGQNASGLRSTVYKSTVNSTSGDIGTFDTTSQTQLFEKNTNTAATITTVGSSSYLHVLGGYNSAANISTVYKSTINSSSGNVEVFSTTNQSQLQVAEDNFTAVTAAINRVNYIYTMGGLNSVSKFSTVYKSTLDTNANISTFATTSQTQIDTGIVSHKTVSTSLSGTSYLYTIGGFNPTGHTLTSDAGIFATTNQGQLLKDLERSYAVTTTIGSSTYVYVIGGNGTVTGRSSSNYKATVNNTTGDVGTFSTTSQAQLLATQHAHAAIIIIPSSYYLYVIGGSQAASISTVYRSIIDSTTGDLGSFTTTSQGQMQIPLNGRPGVASTTVGSSTYIYVMGGCNLCNASLSTLYKSTVNPTTGNVSTFDTTSQIQLPEAREFNTSYATTIGSSSYLYVIGGCTNTCSTANSSILYKSTLNGTTGNVGPFSTTSQGQIPSNLYRHVSIVSTIGSSSYLYLVGGCTAGLCTTVTSTVYKATIDSNNGNLSPFATTNQSQLPVLLEFSPMGVPYNSGDQGYLYVLGGANSSGTSVSTVYKSVFNVTDITGASFSTVYKSTVDSNANAITFSTTSQSQLPSLLHDHAAVLTKVGETNYIYVLGGCFDTTLNCSFTKSGEVGTFATTSQAQLLGIRGYHNTTGLTIGSSTYLYVLGGWNGSVGYFSTLYKSTLDATTGDTGTFATTSQGQLPVFRIYHTTTTSTIGSSTYLYVIGGYDSSNYISTVYKVTINATTGDASTFNTTSQAQVPAIIGVHTTTGLTIGSSTYLYVIGGFKTGTTFSTNYKATLNATTGDIGTFATTSQTQLPTTTAIHTTTGLTIGSSTYLYVIGGYGNGSYFSTLYKSTLNATTGDIGTFATTSQGQLPNEIGYFTTTTSTIGSSTYLYAIGGYDGSSYFSTVYKSTINATTGDAGTFATTVQTQLPELRGYHTTTASTIGSSTYLYVIGGKDGTFADSTNYKTTLSVSSSSPGNSVYRSQIDSSANAGSFSQTNMGQLPIDITAHTVSAAKLGPSTYLYVIGGCNGTSCTTDLSTVYKSNILDSEYDTELSNATVSSSWLVITFSPTPAAGTVQVLIKGGTVIRGGTKLGR